MFGVPWPVWLITAAALAIIAVGVATGRRFDDGTDPSWLWRCPRCGQALDGDQTDVIDAHEVRHELEPQQRKHEPPPAA